MHTERGQREFSYHRDYYWQLVLSSRLESVTIFLLIFFLNWLFMYFGSISVLRPDFTLYLSLFLTWSSNACARYQAFPWFVNISRGHEYIKKDVDKSLCLALAGKGGERSITNTVSARLHHKHSSVQTLIAIIITMSFCMYRREDAECLPIFPRVYARPVI